MVLHLLGLLFFFLGAVYILLIQLAASICRRQEAFHWKRKHGGISELREERSRSSVTISERSRARRE